MPGRYPQLRMRDPDVFLLLPATSLAHRHARILRTFPVDHISFCFTYPDLHHGLLGALPCPGCTCYIFSQCRPPKNTFSVETSVSRALPIIRKFTFASGTSDS